MSTCSSVGKYKNYHLGPSKRNYTYRNYRSRAVRKSKNRRQILSSIILVCLLISAMTWFIWDWQKTMDKVDSLIYQPYIVQSGDTLWSIATSSKTGIDTRTLVQKMIEYNQLTDSTIQTGQLIYAPTSP